MSTRRAMPGGWVDRGSRTGQCRWCGSEVPKGRYTFCSAGCVHQWKLRTDPGYLRAKVLERDKGVCALCGLDTEALRRKKRRLDRAARRAFETEWGPRRSLWDADHIVPVARGGGECDLSNMRTLCLKCHRQVTAGLAAHRSGKCRWCGNALPEGRNTFCSAECVHQWKLGADPAYLRAKVFERDKGVCAACGLDTEAFRRERRKLDWAARRAFEKEWGKGRNLWDPHHGGTEGGLSGIRTLCVKCQPVAPLTT